MKSFCDFMFSVLHVLHSENSSDIKIGRTAKKYLEICQTQKGAESLTNPQNSLKTCQYRKKGFDHILKPKKLDEHPWLILSCDPWDKLFVKVFSFNAAC